jgi:hypothetical protein
MVALAIKLYPRIVTGVRTLQRLFGRDKISQRDIFKNRSMLDFTANA